MFFNLHRNRFAVFCAVYALIMSPLALAGSLVATSSDVKNSSIQAAALNVFKSPTCMCCEKWITYLQSHGFQTTIHHPADLNQEKASRGISPKYQSCHTAVSEGGYVFEGHIPATLIQRFLTQKPKNAIGLAVPSMPMGSPGMEMGDHFTPYDVMLLQADGSSSVFARITRIEQQY